MSSELQSKPFVIELNGAAKRYPRKVKPASRLWQALWGKTAHGSTESEFTALHPCTLNIKKGEVVGLVGKNGAGKSTLLQIVSQTLSPSEGQIHVSGNVRAILELGAGFNSEFSGRENIHLAMATAGLSKAQTLARIEEIIDFSGIRDFIDQPLKTYSSGMYVRLAFSIATCSEPDILIIDEALSVGDGEFARKSFDRIMALRERGTTILFCSHSLFQIESICTRAIWLHAGKIVAQGQPAQVVLAYQEFLDRNESVVADFPTSSAQPSSPVGYARLTHVRVGEKGPGQGPLHLLSMVDDLKVNASFSSDPNLPCPSVAVTLHTPDGRILSSAGAWNDGFELQRDEAGAGSFQLVFARLPLLKGRYYVSVHLFCERGLHIYDVADRVMYLEVSQTGVEQGVCHLPRIWTSQAALPILPAQTQITATPEALLDWLSEYAPSLSVGKSIVCPIPQAYGLNTLAPHFGLSEQPDGSWLKTREPRWTLAWVRSDVMTPDWHGLFEACFGHSLPNDLVQHKYSNHPLAGIGAFADGKLVGFYGCMPRAVILKGQPAVALQIGDVMVHPSERGVLTKKGVFFLSCTTLLEQLMGFDRPFLLGFGFPNRQGLQLAKRQGIYTEVDQMVEINWTVSRFWPDWRVCARQLTSADEAAVNGCWSEMAQAMKSSILGVRDYQFVMQRFVRHPTVDYSVLLVRTRFSNKPLGVVVMRDRGQDGFELVDLVGAPHHFTILVRAALRHAYLRGHCKLMAWATQSHCQLLNTHKATSTPIDVWIPANVWSHAPPPEDLQGSWWLMGGDTDFR
ncbi:GNAT family N-acetyltransferase [Limnohabitans sp.]|uniref:GNAT family N-acetyltransferase n=1 Tax=Limnohabitans sp. TaxID=1907725 RepID=UPI002AFFD450|nr:GNAT family N-acetyltransferase [Limnohabitans sp.]